MGSWYKIHDISMNIPEEILFEVEKIKIPDIIWGRKIEGGI